MSQRSEKYARSLERRMEHCENVVIEMSLRMDADDRFHAAMLAIQEKEVTEEANRQINRRTHEAERTKKRSYLIARILFILALILVVIFLTVFARSAAPQSKTETIQATECQPRVKLLSEETPEDYENMYIEQALMQQGYYRDDVPLPDDMQDVMQSACACYGVPYSLALAVCQTESSFNPTAQNGQCVGYMQIHSINFERLSEVTYGMDPTTPNGNITCGVYLLGELLDKYGDTAKALMAYNCGETGAARLWDKGITSTEYTRTVQARADQWQQLLDQ